MDQKSFVLAAVKLEVWKTQLKFILIYSLDLTNLKASQMKKIEQFQIIFLRSISNPYIAAFSENLHFEL